MQKPTIRYAFPVIVVIREETMLRMEVKKAVTVLSKSAMLSANVGVFIHPIPFLFISPGRANNQIKNEKNNRTGKEKTQNPIRENKRSKCTYKLQDIRKNLHNSVNVFHYLEPLILNKLARMLPSMKKVKAAMIHPNVRTKKG